MRWASAGLRAVITIAALTAIPGRVAHAQTATPIAQSKGYVEAVAQSSFGNVTSQFYGGEAGVTVWKNLQVFVEFGQVRNVASTDLGASAQVIAEFLAQTQSGGATYSVREPVSLGDAGVRYLIPLPSARVQPYVMGGFGVARVSKDVAFFVAGADVTAQLNQLGVVLGSDLSGDYTKPVFVVGGGVVWPVWRQLILDFQFRFNHIPPEDTSSATEVTGSAINIGRVGVGFGIRF